MADLTEKQHRFCEEYLLDLNATQAAIRAGYSQDSAGAIGHENLKKPEIQEYLEVRRKEIAEQMGINQLRILKEYSRIAFSDIRKYYDENGRLKQPKELDEDDAAALCGIEVFEEFGYNKDGDKEHTGDTKKIKTYDKLKALDSLSRHLGMFNDKIDVTSLGQQLAGFNYIKPDEANNSTDEKAASGMGET